MALVFGNEVTGISNEIIDNCDLCIEIPQMGTKHSLNVAVCGGIVCWEIIKQIGIKKI
jgi:tRNA G18 (ribose-2'-O)-methylase SpoU